MIVVLHGQDTTAAYTRLTQILETFKNHKKVRFGPKTDEKEIINEILATDLLGQEKVVVAEGFLAPLKRLPKFLQQTPEETTLIFFEKSDLSPAKIANLQKIAKIEYFKKQSDLFPFLDSIVPNSKMPINILSRLEDEGALTFRLQKHFLLLLLSKRNLSVKTAEAVTKRKIFDWQWEKISTQAAKFDQSTLEALFSGALKIDYMHKSGKTDLAPKTLISILLLKYLTR